MKINSVVHGAVTTNKSKKLNGAEWSSCAHLTSKDSKGGVMLE